MLDIPQSSQSAVRTSTLLTRSAWTTEMMNMPNDKNLNISIIMFWSSVKRYNFIELFLPCYYLLFCLLRVLSCKMTSYPVYTRLERKDKHVIYQMNSNYAFYISKHYTFYSNHIIHLHFYYRSV